MRIGAAKLPDVDETVSRLADAFAQDPITGFLLRPGAGYRERVSQFFSLLMRARIAIEMPVLVARDDSGICGAAMGYATAHPEWPRDLAEEWNHFEASIAGMADRMALYDEIAARFRPSAPHYYLGVIGVSPDRHGRGFGKQLLSSFCERSSSDRLSSGVYLETAQESNVGFYEHCGFVETGRGKMGDATLWCMYLLQDHE